MTVSLGTILASLLFAYLAGAATCLVLVAYVQHKAREESGYDPWEPK